MKTNVQFWFHLAHFFLEWEMFEMKVVEKIKSNFVSSNFFFLSHAVCEVMWTDTVEWGQHSDDSMFHAHSLLGN